MAKSEIKSWKVLRWFVVVTAGLLIGYVGLTTQYGMDGLRLRSWFLVTASLTFGVWGYAKRWERRGLSKTGIAGLGLLMASTLGTLLVADTLYNMVLNRWATPLPFAFEQTSQGAGLEIQLKLPRYRTGDGGRNKPYSVIGGEVFGELVPPSLADDRGFAEKVIEKRWVEYRLDEYGFRATQTAWGDARVVAMGDSFVFGSGIANELHWVSRLESQGIAVYNLGEAGTAPPEQMRRLREIQSAVENQKLTTVIWLIFGGNDLDSPAAEFGDDSSRALEGTLAIGPLRGIEAIRDKAILSRVRRGTLVRLGYPTAYWYAGRLLPAPLYESSRLGAKLFYAPYIFEAQRSEAEILADPELVGLRIAMREMEEIGERSGWRVVVLYAPSAEALLGAEFVGFPRIAEQSPLSQWVSREAAELGFEFLDLSEALQQASQTALPYFRDDTHWNRWGHEVVSRKVETHLRSIGWDNLFDTAD